MTRHTISVLVENKFGVLARIAGLFSGRGYNIHTLNVAPSHDPNFSHMTIVVNEKENVLDQIIKQLKKLVNVVEVIDYRDSENVYRELVLVRIQARKEDHAEVINLCKVFKGEILDLTSDTISLKISGDTRKVENFLTLISDYTIQFLTRTGSIALPNPN